MNTVLKQFWLPVLFLLSWGVVVMLLLPAAQSPSLISPSVAGSTVASPLSTPMPSRSIRYQVQPLASATAHVLVIPLEGSYQVIPGVAETVATVEQFAEAAVIPNSPAGAIAIINAGFFDPANQQSTSFITQNGNLTADPRQNSRLMNNLQLAPYLDQILNRSELRRYECENFSGAGTTRQRYEITLHQTSIPDGCRLVDALSAGPQLLPALTAESEGFLTIVEGRTVRDPIGINQPNARSAIGLTANQEMVWVMVAQQAGGSGSGVTLPELAELLRSLGCIQALNLDGGSSSALFYQGRSHSGKRDDSGQPVQRPVKSVLLLKDLRHSQS